MSYRLKIRVSKKDVPRGAVLAEDAASLTQGLYDSLVRLVQHELGYPPTGPKQRPKQEARLLSRIALTGISDGSGVLEYDLLPAPGSCYPLPPTVVAATSLIQGVAEYARTGAWPGYFPAPVRHQIGAAAARVLEDSASLSIDLFRDGTMADACKIDRSIKDSLQEPESFEVTEPVQLTGEIYDINMKSLVFRLDTSPKKVAVHFNDVDEDQVDKLRWKRVTVKGHPRDIRCSVVEMLVGEIRLPKEEEDDGLLRPEEVGKIEAMIEATEAFRSSERRIKELENLKKSDWDSYNGDAPQKSTLEFSLAFVRGLCRIFLSHNAELPPPFIVPTRTGGVQLEWKIGARELELEIPTEGHFQYLWVSDSEELEGTISRWDAIRYVWRLVMEQER